MRFTAVIRVELITSSRLVSSLCLSIFNNNALNNLRRFLDPVLARLRLVYVLVLRLRFIAISTNSAQLRRETTSVFERPSRLFIGTVDGRRLVVSNTGGYLFELRRCHPFKLAIGCSLSLGYTTPESLNWTGHWCILRAT